MIIDETSEEAFAIARACRNGSHWITNLSITERQDLGPTTAGSSLDCSGREPPGAACHLVSDHLGYGDGRDERTDSEDD